MPASLSLAGVETSMTINGAVDGVILKVYVEQVWYSTLKTGDVVVMNNLPAHKVAGVKELIEGRGTQLIYLPPCSPDFNPIEKCWSKIKTYLRKAKSRTHEELEKALRAALSSVTAEDARGWFKSFGYAIH